MNKDFTIITGKQLNSNVIHSNIIEPNTQTGNMIDSKVIGPEFTYFKDTAEYLNPEYFPNTNAFPEEANYDLPLLGIGAALAGSLLAGKVIKDKLSKRKNFSIDFEDMLSAMGTSLGASGIAIGLPLTANALYHKKKGTKSKLWGEDGKSSGLVAGKYGVMYDGDPSELPMSDRATIKAVKSLYGAPVGVLLASTAMLRQNQVPEVEDLIVPALAGMAGSAGAQGLITGAEYLGKKVKEKRKK